MSSSSWIIAAMLVGTGIAGCQLLLPSEDDDTSATSNVGGAGSSSSRDSSSASKSSGSMKSSSSGETTGSETTQSSANVSSSSSGSATGSVVSSSSGPLACVPGSPPCMGGFAGNLPTNCPATVACDGGDTDCSEYCSAMKSMCVTAYASDVSCCLGCDLARKSKGDGAECCHVTKLNELAGGVVAGDSCTIAGAFGSATNALGGGCGTQQANVCAMYGKLCSGALSGCPQTQCLTYLAEEEALMVYAQNTNPTDKLSHVMDLVLSGNAGCVELVNLFCSPSMSASSSSTGP